MNRRRDPEQARNRLAAVCAPGCEKPTARGISYGCAIYVKNVKGGDVRAVYEAVLIG